MAVPFPACPVDERFTACPPARPARIRGHYGTGYGTRHRSRGADRPARHPAHPLDPHRARRPRPRLAPQQDAQREIARRLAEAFPDELDEVGAAALTGAFIGAISGALQVLLDGSEHPADLATLRTAVRPATDQALAPWLAASHAVTDDPRWPIR
jgi:hypothetical protein